MDLTKREQIQERGIVTDLIIGGMAAGIIISLLVKYIKKIKTISPVIPPIIIKPSGGQLEIEYDREMSDPEEMSNPEDSPNIYSLPSFDWVKKTEVKYYDSEGHNDPFNKLHPSLRGVRVEIYLQWMDSASSVEWDWVDKSTSQITILGDKTDFEVIVKTSGHYLSKEESNDNSLRKFKRSYVGDPDINYRLGQIFIHLYNASPEIKQYGSDPEEPKHFGDQFSLAFNNK